MYLLAHRYALRNAWRSRQPHQLPVSVVAQKGGVLKSIFSCYFGADMAEDESHHGGGAYSGDDASVHGSGGGGLTPRSKSCGAVDAFFDRLLERHGGLDVLVNNAGGQFLSPAEAISPKGFRTVMELNVTGTWLMSHAAATKAFIPAERGKILSVTLSPHNGMPGMVHSGAARAAVENMMRTLAIEWSRFGITTCAIAAGHFATDTLLTKYPREVVENVANTIPLGRTGRPEEVAWLLAYLASPAGDYYSGTTITLDGGRDDWFGPWPPERLQARSGGLPAEERRAD